MRQATRSNHDKRGAQGMMFAGIEHKRHELFERRRIGIEILRRISIPLPDSGPQNGFSPSTSLKTKDGISRFTHRH
jgi:hypothetical protein